MAQKTVEKVHFFSTKTPMHFCAIQKKIFFLKKNEFIAVLFSWGTKKTCFLLILSSNCICALKIVGKEILPVLRFMREWMELCKAHRTLQSYMVGFLFDSSFGF